MNDTNFPVISYSAGLTPREWGQAHGEAHREAIRQLVEIRTQLMREKNSKLTDSAIHELAEQQWQITKSYDEPLAEELIGIQEGSQLTITDLVILNNYTDFRDIQMEDQGCSMVYSPGDEHALAGQTWDMHGSAKDYVCCLQVPDGTGGEQILFSIVGCVGMMGFSNKGMMVGVNNINTDGARAGVLWPALVRKTLERDSLETMAKTLTTAPVTSGHNYLIADRNSGEMWEVLPGLSEKVLDSKVDSNNGRQSPGNAMGGKIFHTNHCLGALTTAREQVISQNSTTHVRFELIEKKIEAVTTMEDLYQLLNDHEGYPKSICSNFQTDSQDPSITCGGAVGNLVTGEIKMWRGDPIHDENFVCRDFRLNIADAPLMGKVES